MANPYVYYVLTFDGASLMAQATATNQIVFVGAISKATAASSDEDLAGKGKSWYDGKTGEIAAVSATDSVAKIVCIFTASGARQDAKSIAITARLASQSDADAVVFCAKSDPDATAILPGSTDTMADVRFPFNISISASGTVQVTPGASASVADLARFVSLHKAGDPTRGDNQDILGVKTFADKICVDYIDLPENSQSTGVQVNANIVPTEDNVYGLGAELAWSGIRVWEVHTTELKNDLDSGTQPINVYSSLRPNGNISLGDSDHLWLTVYTESISLSDTRTITLNSDDDIQINGPLVPDTNASHSIGNSDYRFGSVWASSVIANNISTNGGDEFNAGANNSHGCAWLYCDLTASPYNAQIYIDDQILGETVKFSFDYESFCVRDNTSIVNLGTSMFPWGEVHANSFHGLLPRPSSNSSNRDKPPIGTVFLACIEKDGSSGVTVMYPGTEITPSNQNPDAVAIYYGEITTGPADSGGYRGIFVKGTQIGHPSTARYILMSQADFNTTKYAFAFVQVKSIS